MRAFACPVCSSLVFFDNDTCLTCHTPLAYERASALLVDARDHVRCRNHDLIGCNWIAEDGRNGYCGSCWLTRMRPDDSDTTGFPQFVRTEQAKRYLVHQLDHLELPTTPRSDDPDRGLTFDLVSSQHQPVITGHADGVVTIDLAEGDDPHREAMRVKLAEPYRTMLGHLRHEIGHWYWQVLVDDSPYLDRFRDLFGDERADYAQSLEQHYGRGTDTTDWVGSHVSHYAAAHPWEDWAETFAHYLHIRDTTQTAAAWGVHLEGPDLQLSLAWDAALDVEPVEDPDTFDELARQWRALQLVLNALNRSMGKDDLYPFVLPPAVLDKLRFAHVVITSHRAAPAD
ncbi:zinc-binding metallopeptidase family protein [Jatrophihabitans fulvus]